MDLAVLFIILSAFFTATAQQIESNVSRGSSLTPITNSKWLSRSGVYAFGFYKQGNDYAVGIFLAGIDPELTVVWTANRDGPQLSSNAILLFETDGRLLLQATRGQRIVIAASIGAASASMLNSGNFVLYNSDQQIIWQSFDYPTDTLLSGQRLLAGQQLLSSISESDHSTGIFRLKMQHDGNLVQYPVNTPDTALYAYYASKTGGSGDNVTLNLDADGYYLYLLNGAGYNIRNLTNYGGYTTRETIYLMRIDADGIFRLYSHNLKQSGNWSIIWSSSDDKCDPKGLCGLNAFCVMNDKKAVCVCLPGFAVEYSGNWTSGCARNFIAQSCQSKDVSNEYTVEELVDTSWEDDSYSVLSSTGKEYCQQNCLEDCNCEAAQYSDRTCRKQRLPLRYGRRKLTDPSIAFIKLGITIRDNIIIK
ncbi:G-type lectin S-receptor-like serine/threonine-protein kinase RLK1 [Morella rubra]|uniref:G-type lectin S-receptor-like serine/threonine-protein kinase RLK1 n=1 Tax=Morella rubra TaxID=262757 RepID=A0A6A1WHY4_9ROSI|nr:G-type lectin S-receptor-like serine/threonine-protein kinase RLK1 [Morella rubra]